MRKLILSFAAMLATIAGLYADQPEESVFTLGAFSEVQVSNQIKAVLVRSDVNKVVATGDNVKNMVVKVEKGELRIGMNTTNLFKGKGNRVTVYYKADIDVLTVSLDAEVNNEKTMEQAHLKINANSGGIADLQLKTGSLTVDAASGGKVYTKGSTLFQEINIAAGGFYGGYDLQSGTAYASVTAGGRAEVMVNEKLQARVFSGGTIDYKGAAKDVQTSITLGGKVNRVDDAKKIEPQPENERKE